MGQHTTTKGLKGIQIPRKQKGSMVLTLLNIIFILLILVGLAYLFNDYIEETTGVDLNLSAFDEIIDRESEPFPTIAKMVGAKSNQPEPKTVNRQKPKLPPLPFNEEIKNKSIGLIKDLSGESEVIRMEGERKKKYSAKALSFLLEGDIVKTGSRGKLEILLKNSSMIYVGQKSSFELTTFKSKRRSITSLITLLGGMIRSYVSKSKVKRDFRVRTPHTVMGVRGTDFIAAYSPREQSTSISTIEGNVLLAKTPAITDTELNKKLSLHPKVFNYSTQVRKNFASHYSPPQDQSASKNPAKLKSALKMTHKRNRGKPVKLKKFDRKSLEPLLTKIHFSSLTPREDIKKYSPHFKKGIPKTEPAPAPKRKRGSRRRNAREPQVDTSNTYTPPAKNAPPRRRAPKKKNFKINIQDD